MDLDNREQYAHFLLQSHVDTRLVEFRRDGSLRMVSVIDASPTACPSAVHLLRSRHQPRSSLRHWGVLWQIERPGARLPHAVSGATGSARARRWPTRRASARSRR